ncbi:MAG: phage tail sheath subtilisin-like domain-containing protein [Sandaracinaceae bacterium]
MLRWGPGQPPGVYRDAARARGVDDVRLDVAAFVGLTERGPVHRAVPCESWAELREHFGEPGGGRLLPEAAWAFFRNGGRRCVVVRCVSEQAKTAVWQLPGIVSVGGAPLYLVARDPGAWANRVELRVAAQMAFRPLALAPADAFELDAFTGLARRAMRGELEEALGEGGLWTPLLSRARAWEPEHVLAVGEAWRHLAATSLVAGTLVFALGGGIAEGATLRVARGSLSQWVRVDAAVPLPTGERLLRLEPPLHPPLRDDAALGGAAELTVDLNVTLDERVEDHAGLGLDPRHPRALAQVLRRASRLVRVPEPLADASLELDLERLDPAAGRASLRAEDAARLLDGVDGSQETRREHFFDALPPTPEPTAAAPIEEALEIYSRPEIAASSSFAALDDYDDENELDPVSFVNLPDLLHPGEASGLEPPSEPPAPPGFQACAQPARLPTEARSTPWPHLGPHVPGLVRWQRELVRRCATRRRVAILDAPPHRSSDDIADWARGVASDRAAAYAPWLRAAPAGDARGALLTVPPGGAVCGLIAGVEAARGVGWAPANAVVRGVAGLLADDHLPPPRFLHEVRVNAIRPTERGLVLLGSRTTSLDPDWTHLSARRIVDFLARQLPRDARRLAFEPNERRLWHRLRIIAERRLEQLWQQDALRGADPRQAFFVRAGVPLQTMKAIDDGEALVEVGIAPAAPAEFIVFRLVRSLDGSLDVEERRD